MVNEAKIEIPGYADAALKRIAIASYQASCTALHGGVIGCYPEFDNLSQATRRKWLMVAAAAVIAMTKEDIANGR